VEIIIPYSASGLASQGVSEDSLIPSFFDDTTGTWVKVDNYTIDKEKNVVVARVKHLTRFALVAAGDVVPPSPPTSITGRRSGSGRIYLAWQNPAQDFAYAKVYRSSEANVLGSVVFAKLATNFVEDTGFENGKTYYYTVRTVDPAGNESANMDQIAAVPSASEMDFFLIRAGRFSRDLAYGAANDDEVQILQQLLADLGFYKGPVTGNFYNLTRTAVIAFQKAYGIPAVGRVGPLTRQKLNELAAQPTPSPSPGGPFRFLKDLEYGLTADSDVKELQTLLQKLGLFDGPVNGNFFNLTRQAVIKFQETNGISAVGRVGPQTRAKLNELLRR